MMSKALGSAMAPARLAGIDRFLREDYVDAGKLPGTLLQIWRGGELAHSAMNGFIDLERQRPMREDAIFRIYSMTKPIMAAALLTLVEEGRLALFDKVADHIPGFKGLRVLEEGELVPPRRAMTVLDLARHTSGLSGMGDNPVNRMYRERRIGNFATEGGLDTLIAQLAELPLEFHPGEGMTYSIGATVLGYVMEIVTGMPLGEVLRTRIFEPLGMLDTGFVCPPSKAERLAASYRWEVGGVGFAPDFAHDFTQPPKLTSGDGGLVSTAADYMRFSRMLLNGGALDGVRVLSPKSVELLRLNHLPDNKDMPQMAGNGRFDDWVAGGIGISLCCGTTIDVARRSIPASKGDIFWAGAAATYMLVDPVEDLAVVFMTQMLDAPFHIDLQRRLYTMIYGAFTESRA